MSKAKNNVLKVYQTDFKIYYEMHWSHLFEIDETYPVNIPCKQKQFMIPGPVRWDKLFPFPYKHFLSAHFSGNWTLRTGVSLKEPTSQAA